MMKKYARTSSRQVPAILVALARHTLVGAASAGAQSAPVTACGQELNAPGNYHLTQ